MRVFLRSKISSVRVEDCNLNYEGSITIPHWLMRDAQIEPFEQVQVCNRTKGTRFITYAIPGDNLIVNGAAARLVSIDDDLIIMTYQYLEGRPASFQPHII